MKVKENSTICFELLLLVVFDDEVLFEILLLVDLRIYFQICDDEVEALDLNSILKIYLVLCEDLLLEKKLHMKKKIQKKI